MHRTQLKNSQREIVLFCFARGRSPCRHCWFSIPGGLVYDERHVATPSFVKMLLNVGAVSPHKLKVVITALKHAGVNPPELATVILDATLPRATAGLPRALQLKPEQLADSLAASVGRAGAAHAGLLLARALDHANPGDRILVASLADGCDAAVFEVTSRIAQGRPKHSVDAWIASRLLPSRPAPMAAAPRFTRETTGVLRA